jgi:hypothetical protein
MGGCPVPERTFVFYLEDRRGRLAAVWLLAKTHYGL